ncbi:MAG: hypothetical protein WC869_10370 [Phycisphaerae bacterium]|jgi:hypothetical protein
MADKELKVKVTLDNQVSGPAGQVKESLSGIGDAAPAIQGSADAVGNVGTKSGEAAPQIQGSADAVGNVGTKSGQAVQPLKDAGQAAQQTGDKLKETGEKGQTAVDKLQKLLRIGVIIAGLRRAVKMFNDSLNRMAEDGDRDAIRLQGQFTKLDERIQGVQEALTKKLMPVASDASVALAAIFEGDWETAASAWFAGADAAEGRLSVMADRGKGMGDAIALSALTAGDAMAPLAEKSDIVAMALGREGTAAGLTAQQLDGFRKAQEEATKAAEDLAIATADADVGIYLAGKAIDEALAEDAPLTVETFQNLAGALYDTTQNAQDLGMQLPEGELKTAREKADLLRDALATMNVPPEMQAALKAYLAEIYRNLNDIGASADYVNGNLPGMGGVPGGGAPGPANGGGGSNIPSSIPNSRGGGGGTVINIIAYGVKDDYVRELARLVAEEIERRRR